ncbi:MAG: TonB family protein [Candidatus Solibacter sp.]
MSHADILDQTERLGTSFAGSLAFHVVLAAAIAGAGWIENRDKLSLGDPNGGRFGAVAITPVASINLPSRQAAKNPVATDTESAVPTPVSKPKPAPKVKVPDPKAVPIPSRDAKLRKPSEASSAPDKWRAQQKDAPNQLYSTAGTRVSTPDFAMAGGGGVGVGTNSPFGSQFGAYADLLRNRVAQFWKTNDIRANSAPMVGVTFVLHRDGSATAIRITQKSGNSALDISAQRAVMDAAPFPPLPPGFPKSDAEIEFLFKLKQ